MHCDDEMWIRAKADQVAKFFASDLTVHFEAEETLLFPEMQNFAAASELLAELIAQHREIERLVGQLGGTDVSILREALVEFANLLESHIRKEERELFPLYEKEAEAEAAEEIGQAIREIVGDAREPRNPELLK
jgi:iron-sulfur cluster repair protein YtfE (RIC family)